MENNFYITKKLINLNLTQFKHELMNLNSRINNQLDLLVINKQIELGVDKLPVTFWYDGITFNYIQYNKNDNWLKLLYCDEKDLDPNSFICSKNVYSIDINKTVQLFEVLIDLGYGN